MTYFSPWTAHEAAALIAVPAENDDKYSRGVLGVITGSDQYPGAAVLSVEAALHTGVGMLRYLGPERAAGLVLQRRPEAVTSPGRVQAWLLGSGMDPVDRDVEPMLTALSEGVPAVLDGGALDLHEHASGPVVLTPHYRELARVLGVEVDAVAAAPLEWSRRASERLNATVLLKGHTTHVAGPGISIGVSGAPTWLATAGAGDALGGILGALVATHTDLIEADDTALARLAATAALLHGLAATRASSGGPFTILDLCAAIPATIAELIASFPHTS